MRFVNGALIVAAFALFAGAPQAAFAKEKTRFHKTTASGQHIKEGIIITRKAGGSTGPDRAGTSPKATTGGSTQRNQRGH